MPPLISIVTPSFNQGRFLRRTIDSVLGQDYPYVEYLVLDGGSTDDSVDILRSYGDRFWWRSAPDRGQTEAINQGLRCTRGEILGYLNSDDVLLPGSLAAVAAHFERHPDWEVLYGNAWNIDANDRILNAYPTAACDFQRLLQNCCICQPAVFWRRRVMERAGLFDASLHYAMDYEYWLRLARKGVVLRQVPEFLACSRIHADTKTLAARSKVYDEILKVSRRHAGEASFPQYFACWHHRCHESPRGWARWLRWWPQCHWWLAVAHQRWHRQLSPLGVTTENRRDTRP